ncbi:HV01 protein, partial [Onychorhynchus coronatus]|nr:HV01 protein [Onychorhynchus coronatus]
GLWAQWRLEETGGGQRAPGEFVLLSCRVSGFSFGGYGIRWYRRAPGGGLEWVSSISSSGNVTKYGASVEGRATASRDSFQPQSSLSLRALHARDSARYFCAFARR